MNQTINTSISGKVISMLSVEQAWHYRAVPFEETEQGLLVFVGDSSELGKTQELEIILGRKILTKKVPESELTSLLSEHYKKTYDSTRNRSIDVGSSEDFLEALIREAKILNSSDLHIEMYESSSRVRYRIDGVLVERYQIKAQDYPVFINKLKIKAHLDIAEKRLPQDGRISFKGSGDHFDIRVSVIPTLHGEKVVLRLLNRDATEISLDRLGMSNEQLVTFRQAIGRPNGIILISGPTGSGKTTTLYASLKELNSPERNILTIEDPIEYTLDGINQVQLKEGIGLGFPEALRSFLRQDPDIIMLGEIRDKETAEMAIRASLTGHQVFSTIHTNSAWATVSRLSDMGIPNYLLASTLNTSIAQRLVRVLCKSCKRRSEEIQSGIDDKLKKLLTGAELFIAQGCPECYNTGYLGRTAIYELIPIEGEFRRAIRTGQDIGPEDLKSKKISTLRDAAIELIRVGITSIDEAYPLLISE